VKRVCLTWSEKMGDFKEVQDENVVEQEKDTRKDQG
jgi:hypothetical protein